MNFWDFDEDINFKIVKYKNSNFKVLNLNNANIAAQRLYEISFFINYISSKVAKYLPYMNHKLKTMSNVFLSIHPDNYYLQEMQLNTDFLGLNKPKEVYYDPYVTPVGKDTKYRARYRGIFLTLRNTDNRVKKFDELIPLVLHEIAHTGCNHVKWRDDDHGPDFSLFENYLYFLMNE